ncbi:BamA/TamA family outer membrane protein [candidate division TA06 bacterium]|nr:BamA/TamA family outer membrane protein [candidate division TA06 bacterium]
MIRGYIRYRILYLPLCLLTAGSIFASEKQPLHRADSLVIKKIEFEGNEALSDRRLKKEMKSREGGVYKHFLLSWDIRRIEDLYYAHGYLEAKVVHQKEDKNLEKKSLSYTFTIYEGPLTIVDDIQIVGNRQIEREFLKKKVLIRPGEPLLREKVTLSRFALFSTYEERGFLYTEVNPHITKGIGNDRVLLTFHIDEGPLVRVEGIEIEGNKKVRRKIIEREVTVKVGEVYSPRKAYESQRRIYSTGLFKDVKFVPEGKEEGKDKIKLLFRVKEAKPKWIAFGGGLRSSEWLLLKGEWGHNNIAGNGQRLSAQLTFSPNLRFNGSHLEELNIRYVEPYLISTPYTGMLHFFVNRERNWIPHPDPDSSRLDPQYTALGGDLRIGRDFGQNIKGHVEYRIKKAYGEDVDKDQDLTTSLLTSGSWDTRNNLLDPRRGHFLNLTTEVAGIGLGDNRFTRWIFEGSIYYQPLKKVVLASRLRCGVIFPFGDKEVPFDEGFELKGVNVIRGLDEVRQSKENVWKFNPNINVELRFQVYKRIWAGYFVDMGGLWNEVRDWSWDSARLGAGFGIRYNTVIGPVRVDYGHPLKDPKRSTSERGKIYFSIGHLF